MAALLAEHSVGWVFVGYPDERLDRHLVPGRIVHWRDARTMGVEADQPVLFLQLDERSGSWVGSGRIVDVEERWRAFGVRVRCLERLERPLPAVPGPVGPEGATTWENRTLAARLGLATFRTRTPFLDEGRVHRLTAADLDRLVGIQPALRPLWPG